MKVLFITSNRLGDAVLSTGLLDYITRHHPDAKVTLVCGALPASLFEGLPGLEELIILRKKSWHRHWLFLWQQVAGTRWDMVVDLRNSAVSRLIRARARYIFGPHIDHSLHKVEQNAAVMKLSPPPAPRLWPSAGQKKQAVNLIPEGGSVLAVGPTANWIGKTWPVENFIKLVAALTAPEGLFPKARVAVFAAPGEEADAYRLLETVPKARQLDLIARTDPGTAAAALARCDFYVGNDSGLMHCAAAAGIPTFGLFGPSWPHLYRPWGAKSHFIQTDKDFAELTDFPGYDPKTLGHSLMESLTVENVLAAIEMAASEKNAGKA